MKSLNSIIAPMKIKLLLQLMILTFVISCNNITDKNIDDKHEPENDLHKFGSIREMLIAAGDYKEDEGRLKFISDNNELPHIQVSNWVLQGTDDNEIKKQAKRNVVYLAFQVFARTDIEEILITSIPLNKEDNKYLEEYTLTIRVKRSIAKQIIKKHLGIHSFEEIYGIELSGQYYSNAPNINFNKLQYLKLETVFEELDQ